MSAVRNTGNTLPGFEPVVRATSLFNHSAVALYRRICRRKPNETQRKLIAESVGDSGKALGLYEEILDQFMIEGRPPQRVDWTIERFRNAWHLMQPAPEVREQPAEVRMPTLAEIRASLGYTGDPNAPCPGFDD